MQNTLPICQKTHLVHIRNNLTFGVVSIILPQVEGFSDLTVFDVKVIAYAMVPFTPFLKNMSI